MRLATPSQMREIERLSEVEYALTPEILMECAGSISAREIGVAFLPELHRGRAVIVCGSGNNGGDGLVVARHLFSQGYLATEVFLVGDPKTYSKLFKLQLARAEKQGLKIVEVFNDIKKMENARGATLIVDAIFGIGLSRPIEGDMAEIIKFINASSIPVVSLDIPTGIDAMTGQILGCAIKSQMTLTFGLSKPGLYLNDGPEYASRIRVLQISFPRQVFKKIAKSHVTFSERQARRWLPVRKVVANKSKNGNLLVIAGSPGMWGAAALSCDAAARTGAGYVTLAVQDRETSKKYLGRDIGDEILVAFREDEGVLEKRTAVMVGPGAGHGQKLESFIERLLSEKIKNVLIDADGLTALSKMNHPGLPQTWVLTPHAGELSRLIGVDAKEIESNRLHFASLAASKFGCVVLLKGFRTVVAHPDDHHAIILSGGPALAKAGTGDVLSGMISALMAQEIPSFSAACTGAYLHGRLADDWLRDGEDVRSLLPTDLTRNVSKLLSQISCHPR